MKHLICTANCYHYHNISCLKNSVVGRSYHHLFPVEPYEEVANEGQAQYCFGCLRPFTDVDKQVSFCKKNGYISTDLYLRIYRLSCALCRGRVVCWDFSSIVFLFTRRVLAK